MNALLAGNRDSMKVERKCRICGSSAKEKIHELLCTVHYSDYYYCSDYERRKNKRKEAVEILGGKCSQCGIEDNDLFLMKNEGSHITPSQAMNGSREKFFNSLHNFHVLCYECYPNKSQLKHNFVIKDTLDTFAGSYPMFVENWSEQNSTGPSEIHKRSREDIQWNCYYCRKSWIDSPYEIVKNITKYNLVACPDCIGKQVNNLRYKNTIAYLYPEVANMFSDSSPVSPEEITRGTTLKVVLTLSCGHDREVLLARYLDKKGNFNEPDCKECATVAPKESSLLRICPELEQEYSHHNERSFSSLTYNSAYKAIWECSKGHVWKACIYQRVNGKTRCPECGANYMGKETEVYDFVSSILPENIGVLRGNREVLDGKEIDILIPGYKIGIEFNGLYWHGEKFGCDRNYHNDKRLLARSQGYRLVTIWEDDWDNKKHIVKNTLRNILYVSRQHSIDARRANIAMINNHDAFKFMDDYHTLGRTRGSYYIGLKDDQGNVVAISIWRRNKKTLYLDRYATSCYVVGGLEKLLSYVKKEIVVNNGIEKIVTFSDNQISDGKLYESLGFEKDKELKPDYKYVVNKKRMNKSSYRRKYCKNNFETNYNEHTSVSNRVKLNGIDRVWDCGKTRWVMYV